MSPRMDRTLHTISEWLFIVVPILCVWRWRAWGILIGALAFWALGSLEVTLRSRIDPSGGTAGFILILGGLWGAFYCGFIWLIITGIREGVGLCRRGVCSYREHTAQGVAGGRRLLLIWRDLNRREETR